MFEMVVALCMGAGEVTCREALLPGFESATEAACGAQTPVIPAFLAGTPVGAPFCREVGGTLTVQEVAPGLFVHEGRIEEPDQANRGDVSNLAFVIGERSVAVIDSGSARWIGESLWRAIRARTDLPVSHVILTHMHPDHVFGASVLAEAGARVMGHAGLPRALLDREQNYLESLRRLLGDEAFAGTMPPRIDSTVAQETTIDLGGRVMRLVPHGPAHTGVDLSVVDEATGTLIAGDLLFHRHTPALDGSIRGWQREIAGLTDEPFTRVVPGHGAASLPWPEGAEALTRYLDALAHDTRAAIDAGERLGAAVEQIAESERPYWVLFDAYNPRNATVAFTELEWE
ncbi:quinoprotein relay system zinc metallohydrolase 2 [Sagittula salina]|uniref:Quinoprotein relay system zinc metallohydrolase 2 n=1 Tax=Sagittula salina TaxID=2820268 RepID=A0A940S342_9RHOB|nr:quinoprotein relay system zinc metallohydrolase 2 [Sagittula salina]MBP0484701.1 quinoprotein relay system zinc metallohydrolase 2 [Sagittula salina]